VITPQARLRHSEAPAALVRDAVPNGLLWTDVRLGRALLAEPRAVGLLDLDRCACAPATNSAPTSTSACSNSPAHWSVTGGSFSH